MEKDRLGPLSTLLGTVAFIIFGIIGYINLTSPLKPTNLFFGAVVGLIFRWVSKRLLSTFLTLLNPDIKVKHGKKTVSKTIKRSTIFMLPYAILALLATFFLGWATAGLFFSAGIMNTGVTANIELGKLKEKNAIKNSIVTGILGAFIAFLWIFSATYLKNIPAILDGLVSIVISMTGGASL